MISLRPYKQNDATYIINWIDSEEASAKWCANRIPYPLTEEGLKEVKDNFENDDKGWMFTALDEAGVPVGFFVMIKTDYKEESCHLGFVLIDSSQRKQGLGKQMIKKAIKYAFEILEVSKVTLKVFDNNPVAYACYLESGFTVENYVKEAFPYKDQLWGCYDMAIISQTYPS